MTAIEPLTLIRGADVIDGSGAPRFAADVTLLGEHIAGLHPPGTMEADRVIDAHGLVLSPGFIDTHSHDDLLVLQDVWPHPKLSQGVTTVVTGNCGISLAPSDPGGRLPAPLDILGTASDRFADFDHYLATLDARRPVLNVAPLIGHISLRVRHVAALDRTATADEIAAMRSDVERALSAGAFGLSTGVYYPPAAAASTEELGGVCAALRGQQAVLAMHLRDEGDHVDVALREALAVSGACGARLVVSHHKVVGERNHGRTRETLALIDEASQRQSVCLDCYPYEASSTMLEPQKAARTSRVMITWSGAHPEQGGRWLSDIAHAWGLSTLEAAQRLLPGGAIYFGMDPSDVDRVLRHPLAMFGSDGLPHQAHPHPRLWGTFARLLGHHARERGLMSLEATVHKMTGLPARRFGLADRGLIAPGKAADLVLFDPLTVRDNATYEHPTRSATGFEAVFVNGVQVRRSNGRGAGRFGKRLRPSRLAATQRAGRA